jgi:hypothetical protein
MDKIYVWYAKDRNVGHSSLDIAFGEGVGKAEYVSWWPMGAYGPFTGTAPGQAKTNYVEDRDEEGRDADDAIEINCLDSALMRDVWMSWKKNASYYHMFKQNCSHAVATLLHVGGGGWLDIVDSFYRDCILFVPSNVFLMAHWINKNGPAVIRGRSTGTMQKGTVPKHPASNPYLVR